MKSNPVLIADDDEMIRQLYRDALELAGIPVITAKNGAEAVTAALKHHRSVILIDIMMPEMNGHEAVEKIRLDSWGRTAKIVYLTNLSDPTDVVTAFEQKTAEYIVKANTDVKDVVNQVRLVMHQN